jgi:hypothetical protein
MKPQPDHTCKALLITGTVGVGKTAVADALGDVLAEANIANAVIDLDWLRRAWPAPAGDRFSGAMAIRNLRSVAGNYRAAGALRLVLAGVIESPEDRAAHEEAVGADLTVCRLRADLDVVRRRLAGRHEETDPVLRWHLTRAGELDAIRRRQARGLTVETDGATIADIATEVAIRAQAGSPPPPPRLTQPHPG